MHIDDILIFSDTWEEHIQHVRQVLDRLARTGFTAKLTKCLFGFNEIRFVGHTVGKGKITLGEAKVAALLSMPVPNSKPNSKTIFQSFIGLANYCSRYVPKFADITSNLTCLLQKNKKNHMVRRCG